MSRFTISPEGDRALVADFGNIIDEKINDEVNSLASMITAQKISGVSELLPTYRSLVVFYDPLVLTYGELRAQLEKMDPDEASADVSTREVLEVPCCYEEEFAPDLKGLSDLSGLSTDEIIKIHSGITYKIYMLGFLPGFVYLGGLDKRIAAPRLDSPRTSIPARSVGIGGSQTGVYPIASPGGWRLIGSTPLEFYDPSRQDPILCHAGEYIHFSPVSKAEYTDIRKEVAMGGYIPVINTIHIEDSADRSLISAEGSTGNEQ